MTHEQKLYKIACSFPALQQQGVATGGVPGIGRNDFYDIYLTDYLYTAGGELSRTQFLILEALLNLCDPYIHDGFNLGQALHTLDPQNMRALINAIRFMYIPNNEQVSRL